jgi:hypothetical protein
MGVPAQERRDGRRGPPSAARGTCRCRDADASPREAIHECLIRRAVGDRSDQRGPCCAGRLRGVPAAAHHGPSHSALDHQRPSTPGPDIRHNVRFPGTRRRLSGGELPRGAEASPYRGTRRRPNACRAHTEIGLPVTARRQQPQAPAVMMGAGWSARRATLRRPGRDSVCGPRHRDRLDAPWPEP